MAATTPTILRSKFVGTGAVNTYFLTGLTPAPDEGVLLVYLSMPNQSSYPFKSAAESTDDWYGLNRASTPLGDNTSSFSTSNLTDVGSLTNIHLSCVPVWKIAEGDEIATRDLIGQFGGTAFNNAPRFHGLLEISGFDSSVPVRMHSSWRLSNESGVTRVLPSEPAGTVKGNALELLVGVRRSGTTAGAWNTGTLLSSGSNATSPGASYIVHTRTVAADGSLAEAEWSGTGALRATRIVIQGAEPSDPAFLNVNFTAEATVTATARNLSQERRNAGQARDRREHIWVSDLNGVRKVVLR
jgi:hypothetical protein